MYYFGARWYEPKVGRFVTKDPWSCTPNDERIVGGNVHPIFAQFIITQGLNKPQNLHPYMDCYNNPINWIDPYGYCGETPWWLIAGGLTLSTPWPGDEELAWILIVGYGAWISSKAVWDYYMVQSRQINPPAGYGGKRGQQANGKIPRETPPSIPKPANEPPPQPWTLPEEQHPPGEGVPGGEGHPAFPPPFGPGPGH